MDKMPRARPRVPRESVLLWLAALGLILPAWVKGINLLLLLGLMLLALWLVNWALAARQVRGLTARRRWLGPIFAGSESHWEVEVRNQRVRPAAGFRLIDAGPDHEQTWFIDHLPPAGEVRLQAAVTLPRRGRYVMPRLAAACQHPFGLAQRSRSIGAVEECVVLPKLGRLNVARFQRWLLRMTHGEGQLHRLARPSMIHQDDLHGLRPFRAGDNPRWIHWRTSARRNLRMVREFEEDTGRNLILLVEPFSLAPSALDGRLEAAISLAATICWEWCRLTNDYLLLGVAGSKPMISSGFASRDSALEMLNLLALATGEPRIDPGLLAKALGAIVVPEAPVLLISPQTHSPLTSRLSNAWNRRVIPLTPEDTREFYDASAAASNPALLAVNGGPR